MATPSADPLTARAVRVAAALGAPDEAIAVVVGVPTARVIEIRSALAAGYDAATVAADASLVALVDRIRAYAPPPPSAADIEEMARWLADASDSPRYSTAGLGWRTLLDSPANIVHAHAAAARRTASNRQADRLDAVRDALLRHAGEHADARP